jgi:FkbM family methyltransferase
MGIVSYAQNFEDVMLWRALGHIEHGFYVDIGAQHPTVDSVSKAFYEKGWRGVHVEPTAGYAEMMRRERPGDLVVQGAVASRHGLLPFFEIPDSGLSTASAEIAEHHRTEGWAINPTIVTSMTMDDLLGLVASGDIHWLKIDVEGYEQAVLAGWQSSERRPWIVVIESTYPNSQAETHDNWEPLILAKGYAFVYRDGLNRYYLSAAHPELVPAFRSGPNVFDAYQLADTCWSVGRIRQSRKDEAAAMARQHEQLSEELAGLRQAMTVAQAAAEQRERQLETLLRQAADKARSEAQQRLAGLAEHDRECQKQLLRLREEHAREAAASAARESKLREEHAQRLTATKEEIAALALRLFDREAAYADQSEELRRGVDEAIRERSLAHAKREQELKAELTRVREERTCEVQKAAERERRLREDQARQVAELKQAADALARRQIDREAALIGQLNESQREADESKEQLSLVHAKREQELRSELTRLREEFSRELKAASERERNLWKERTRQLAAAKEDAQVREELLCARNAEQLATVTAEHRERESALVDALEGLRMQLRNSSLAVATLKAEIQAVRRSWPWRWVAPLLGKTATVLPSNTGDIVPVSTLQTLKAYTAATADASTQSACAAPDFGASARSFSNPSGKPQTEPIPMTLNDLLALSGESFVRAAYRILLGREADDQGLVHYRMQLALGFGKAAVLGDLASSREATCREQGEDLMSLDGDSFIDAAYQRLLGRSPDPDGKSSYLASVQGGASKRGVFAAIRDSEEGKAHSMLYREIRTFLRGQVPSVGIAGWLRRSERLERRIGEVESLLERAIEEAGQRATQTHVDLTERTTAAIGNLAQQLEQRWTALPTGPSAAAVSLPIAEPKIGELSAAASRHLRHLIAAQRAHQSRGA